MKSFIVDTLTPVPPYSMKMRRKDRRLGWAWSCPAINTFGWTQANTPEAARAAIENRIRATMSRMKEAA